MGSRGGGRSLRASSGLSELWGWAQESRRLRLPGGGREQRRESWQEPHPVVSQGKLGNQVKLQLPLQTGPAGRVLCGGGDVLSPGPGVPQGSIFPPTFPHSFHSCQLNACIMFCGAGIPWIIKPLPWSWKFRLCPHFCYLEFVAEIVVKCISVWFSLFLNFLNWSIVDYNSFFKLKLSNSLFEIYYFHLSLPAILCECMWAVYRFLFSFFLN